MDEHTLTELEAICRRQYRTIETQKLHIWDIEEENRVLEASNAALLEEADKDHTRIEDLEHWCAHLQDLLDKEVAARETREQQYEVIKNKLGIFFRLALKIKHWLVRS